MTVGRAESLPKELEFRRLPDGVEITFVKPPFLRGSTTQLWIAMGVSSVLMGLGLASLAVILLGTWPLLPTILFTLVFVYLSVAVAAEPFDWKREWGVIALRDGQLTYDPSHADYMKWRVEEIAKIEAGMWGLDIVGENGVRTTILKKRNPSEIRCIAGLLRAALPSRRVEVGAVRVEPGGECQVCGAALDGRVVFCAKCRTPHHEECWLYNGMCSTYGCREIRSTRPA